MDLNNLLRKYAPLKTKVYHLVSVGSSLDLSADEKDELRDLKNEIDEWQKKVNENQ